MSSDKESNSDRVSGDTAMSISGLNKKHQQELVNLTLASQPFQTLKLFVLAVREYLRKSIVYLLSHGNWFVPLSAIIVITCTLLLTVDGPHEKHVEEVVNYVRFGLWWVALGVASSIGLGSGLHTFVLYLGPHIALFTIKATQCGRTDIKSAPYDTIQLKRGPSWLGKDCADFGPSIFQPSHGVMIPLSSILPHVQLEAILWGLGTALGELPPYFISRAARLSGSTVNTMDELDGSSTENDGLISAQLNKTKRWFLSHSQYLNFFTILVLASVPNPLFDLAGIMCGQFGIPFWEFFFATIIGKAIIKTHIQTVFIICVCNNQLLYWIENELLLVPSFLPGFSSILPRLITKLQLMKDKYLATKPHAPSNAEARKWDFSLGLVWNTVVWIMLLNFFVKIVNSTAQRYLKKQQDKEIAALKIKLSEHSDDPVDNSSR